MTDSGAIARHYSVEEIVGRIKNGLDKLGITSVTVDDLSLADEFHIGGRKATEHFFPQLGFENGQTILDVGCGIGGGARFAASRYGATVKGVDLTPAFVEAGSELNKWVDLEDSVTLEIGDAASLRHKDNSFNNAFSMHVCMNIEDKISVFREVNRVLKPGGVFGLYDPMKLHDGSLRFPVPWAADDSTSFLATIDDYVTALELAGFEIISINNRHQFAVEFFDAVLEKMAGAEGPPPLGIHILMGADAAEKIKNLTANLVDGLVAPFEVIARKL